MKDLLTTDVLGYTCVAEEDLDAAFFNQGKGGSVPQTCITEATPSKDCATLTELLGREASYEECGTYAYRWLSVFDPERKTGWGFDCGKCVIPAPIQTSVVPLPGAMLTLLSALGLLTMVRRFS